MKYDPLSGILQNNRATPLKAKNPMRLNGKMTAHSGVIASLVCPTDPPRLERQPGSDRSGLAELYVIPRSHTYTGPLIVLPGCGLLPFDPDTLQQYKPEPPAHLLESWGDREVDPLTGRIGLLQNQKTVSILHFHENPDTGRTTTTTLHRAQIIAAAALGYHPLTPVMAWYTADPELHGYGIDNIYTPTAAGIFQFKAMAPPPGPHETTYPQDGSRAARPRYVFTPWQHAEGWTYGTPPTKNSFML